MIGCFFAGYKGQEPEIDINFSKNALERNQPKKKSANEFKKIEKCERLSLFFNFRKKAHHVTTLSISGVFKKKTIYFTQLEKKGFFLPRAIQNSYLFDLFYVS